MFASKITEQSLLSNLDSFGMLLPELLLIGAILLIVFLDLVISNRKTALLVSMNVFLLASVAMIVLSVSYCMQCECSSIQQLFYNSGEMFLVFL